MMNKSMLEVKWCTSQLMAQVLVDFFLKNSHKDYIGTSDYYWRRVNSKGVLDIEKLKDDFSKYIDEFNPNDIDIGLLTASYGNNLVAFTLIDIVRSKPNKMAVICDFIVSSSLRKHNIGTEFLKKTEKILKDIGISKIMLETNTNNIIAIKFFEKNKYLTTSLMKMKTI